MKKEALRPESLEISSIQSRIGSGQAKYDILYVITVERHAEGDRLQLTGRIYDHHPFFMPWHLPQHSARNVSAPFSHLNAAFRHPPPSPPLNLILCQFPTCAVGALTLRIALPSPPKIFLRLWRAILWNRIMATIKSLAPELLILIQRMLGSLRDLHSLIAALPPCFRTFRLNRTQFLSSVVVNGIQPGALRHAVAIFHAPPPPTTRSRQRKRTRHDPDIPLNPL